jgi:hypothetical protein
MIGIRDAAASAAEALGAAVDKLDAEIARMLKRWTDGGQIDEALLESAVVLIGVKLDLAASAESLRCSLSCCDAVEVLAERGHDAPIH